MPVRVITSTNAGLFANLCDVLRHIIIATDRGDEWFVNWGSESLYYDESKGKNVWNYFFNQPHSADSLRNRTDLYSVQGYAEIPYTGAAFKAKMNAALQLISFKTSVVDIFDQYVAENNIGQHTVGVHYRGTDKYNGAAFGEPASAMPINAELYMTYIQQLLHRNPQFINVFVATDDSRAAQVFKQHNCIIRDNVIRGSDKQSVHANMPGSGYDKGLQVLLDCLILSYCGYLVRSTSNVSSVALFADAELKQVNLNEILCGDIREREYGIESELI